VNVEVQPEKALDRTSEAEQETTGKEKD